MKPKKPQLSEFIFGSLETDAGRLKRSQIAKLGLYHDSTLTPAIPQENQPISIQVRAGIDLAIKSLTLYYSTDRSTPDINQQGIPLERTEIEWDTLMWGYWEQWIGKIPPQAKGTLVRYSIVGTTIKNERIFCPYFDPNLPEVEEKDIKKLQRFIQADQPQVYSFYVDNDTIPDWFEQAIIYQIFVDRFAPNPDQKFAKPKDRAGFYGGTLKGIISKLNYLENLGINCLWLTPIFASPSHHGYDPIDYSQVEPRLGTQTDWDNLAEEAKKRHIKIVLDYVANHVSDQNPTFIEARKNQNSPLFNWFRFRKNGQEYDSFYDVPHQPELNGENPEVREYLLESACDWLTRGAAGFRLDYAQGLSHAFWSEFRHAIRQVKSDSIMFGEITEPPDIIRSFVGRMDGCLDFKLLEILRGFFAFESFTVSQFHHIINQHFGYFESSLLLPSFLDNHDMNRFLWIVDNDKQRLKLAALFQFTLPHPPIIYYGTEVGLSQIQEVGRLEESRLPMLWDDQQDRDLLQFYQKLIALRRQNCQTWKLPHQALLLDDLQGIYAYKQGHLLIILNNSPKTQKVYLPELPESTLVLATDTPGEAFNLSPYWGGIYECRA
jgi:glycosidase